MLAALFIADEWYARPFFINNYFNRVFIQFIWDKPQMLTSMGILEPLGINEVTRIHAKRWTREQAIAYMLENTGMAESDVILKNGALPLTAIREQVMKYIAGKQAV